MTIEIFPEQICSSSSYFFSTYRSMWTPLSPGLFLFITAWTHNANGFLNDSSHYILISLSPRVKVYTLNYRSGGKFLSVLYFSSVFFTQTNTWRHTATALTGSVEMKMLGFWYFMHSKMKTPHWTSRMTPLTKAALVRFDCRRETTSIHIFNAKFWSFNTNFVT